MCQNLICQNLICLNLICLNLICLDLICLIKICFWEINLYLYGSYLSVSFLSVSFFEGFPYVLLSIQLGRIKMDFKHKFEMAARRFPLLSLCAFCSISSEFIYIISLFPTRFLSLLWPAALRHRNPPIILKCLV